MTGQNGHYCGDLAFQDKENCICYLVRSVIVAYVHVLTDHVDYLTRVLVDCLDRRLYAYTQLAYVL